MSTHIVRNDSLTTLCDESCPLLYDQSHPQLEAQKPTHLHPSPLPKHQLASLCMTRLVDPIAFTQVFPYINQFLASLHLGESNPSQIGFYSGLVESSFAISQLCSIYQWAKLSDLIGRRPIIICGALGLALTTLFFGVSTTFTQILILRCLAGIFSGNAAVVLSVLGELTDSTNQALAFPIFGLFWPLGSIIGPLIGGTFANPAERFPSIFDIPFLRNYPYFLPCLISAVIAFIAVIAAYFYLDETLPGKRQPSVEISYGTLSKNLEPPVTASESTRVLTIYELFSIPIIRDLSISGCALCFIATAYDVVFVLFCYTPILSGGLGFSAAQIGYSLAVAGSISAGIQLFFLPSLLRTFNNAKLYHFCISLWPMSFAILPLLNVVAKNGVDLGSGFVPATTDAIIWVGIALTLGISRIGCLAYSISMVLVKESVPSPASLGATNGLVQFAMCFSRAFSPAFVSSAFAWSLEKNVLGGHMWVIIMIVISIMGRSLSKSVVRHR
ncbi:hypothetical protein AX17_003431 [Amanita inopinata Kibby_2008]|nr:hypothetical protein AX17_003431 [Amanita inopinata Kibby_2008]